MDQERLELINFGIVKLELNATFLTMVPKISNMVKVINFRSISLVGCIYKILSKVLVSCFQEVMPEIITLF